ERRPRRGLRLRLPPRLVPLRHVSGPRGRGAHLPPARGARRSAAHRARGQLRPVVRLERRPRQRHLPLRLPASPVSVPRARARARGAVAARLRRPAMWFLMLAMISDGGAAAAPLPRVALETTHGEIVIEL